MEAAALLVNCGWMGHPLHFQPENLGTSGCSVLQSGSMKFALVDCMEIHQPLCKIGKILLIELDNKYNCVSYLK